MYSLLLAALLAQAPPIPVKVEARVLTTGRMVGFLFGDGALSARRVSQSAHPTIRINGGAPVQLSGAIACGQMPWVIYPIASNAIPDAIAIKPADVVTFSAPDGWAITMAGRAPPAVDQAVANFAGKEMFPLPPITMPMGINLQGEQNVHQVHVLRNLRKVAKVPQATADGSYATTDANFNPTAFVGPSANITVINSYGNGIDDLNQPGAPGVYPVTWDDYSPGRGKLCWLAAWGGGNTVVAPVGSKTAVATAPDHTTWRQSFRIAPSGAPGANHGLNSSLYFDAPYPTTRNIRIHLPGEDPDSPLLTSDAIRRMAAGARTVRFMNGGEGGTIEGGSNAATYDHVRKRDDFGAMCRRNLTARVDQVQPISGGSIRWNGGTYPVKDRKTLFPGGSQQVALRVRTTAPHGFSTGMKIAERYGEGPGWNLSNATASDGADRNGVRVLAGSGSTPAWVGFGDKGGTIWVVDDTHFDVNVWVGVASDDVMDPDGVQSFDPAKSTVTVAVPQGTAISYGEQVQAAIELGAYLHLSLGECMEDACVAAIARECRDTWVAMGSPPWFRIYAEWSNEAWNYGYPAYILTLVMGRALGLAGPDQAYAYMANRATTAFKSAWVAAGGPADAVRRVLSCQYGNAGNFANILGFARSRGYTAEAVADAPYLELQAGPEWGSQFDPAAWAPLDAEQMHDVWEWVLQYGAGCQGFTPARSGTAAAVALYYPDAERIGYESHFDLSFSPDGDMARRRDFFYHPRMYRTFRLACALIQGWGYAWVNKWMIAHGAPEYALYMWAQQPAGPGLNNVFAATKAANVNQDWGSADGTPVQESVAAQAWLDWNAAAGGGPAAQWSRAHPPTIPIRRDELEGLRKDLQGVQDRLDGLLGPKAPQLKKAG